MTNYHNILVAIDLYENFQSSLTTALEIAKRHKAKLSIVHVLPHVISNVPYAYDFQAKVEEEVKDKVAALEKSLAGHKVEIHLLHGSPKVEVCALAEKIHADLIVVGSHGKHGIQLLLGSTANGILHLAKCNVLTLRLDDQDKHKIHGYKKILLATDLEKDDQKVLAVGKQVASEYHAELKIISVVPNTAALAAQYIANIEQELQKRSEQKMKALCDQFKIDPAQTNIVIGQSSVEILAEAEAFGADLIIIGSHGKDALRSALLGSTAHAVLHGAKDDVLVVRI